MFNKIYVNYSDGFKSSFLAPTYGVQVDKVSFNYPGAATAYINKVIGQMTLKRLTDVLIKGDITTDTTMLLVNGAYLKATWEDPFDVHLTKYTKFIKYDGTTVMIPIMHKKEHMLFVHDDLNKVKVVSLKLASYGAYFTIVIPEDKRSFDDFLKNLRAPNFLKTVKKRMRQEYIHVAIPRFKIKTLVDWTESLKMFGLSTLFETNNAGLDGILKDNILKKHVHLSKVKQKNFIDFNEMGAFRVVTPAGFENFARAALINKIPPRLEAMADRPFYFEIGLQYDMSDFTKTEDLFAGIYCGPEA
ncbi:unnamed protein product [Leptosia nina]|uniref:Serpin domain-containing protein n=1 Tax=Leptosia nina TaxID=320188 RepID=A0AAV1J5W3_9NEOP